MDNADDKTRLIEAAMGHVPFDGWTKQSLSAAAAEIGMSADVAGLLFPDLPGDMIDAYVRMSDTKMEQRLPADFEAMRIRDKVTTCVRIRMEISGEHEEATRLAVRAYATPRYISRAATSSYKTADVIWTLCGDTATDYNRYTKRAILSSVYRATLLYWLQDTSEGKEDTWAFLDRRIADVMRFEKIKGKVTKRLESVPNPLRFLRRGREEEVTV